MCILRHYYHGIEQLMAMTLYGPYRAGGALPRDILGSASIQVGSSFLLVGGKCGSCDPPFVDSIVEWDPLSEMWFDRPETIQTGRFRHSGMLVSDHITTCSARKRYFQANKYN